MSPPRAKLHKNSGKSHPGSFHITRQPSQDASVSEPSSSNGSVLQLSPEQEQQFEAELYWCIQQLQTALSSNKLNNKQIQDHTKALNTLMSNSAPLIKKRQVMRLSFGNYREKMAAEEKKCRKLTVTVRPARPSEKSVFFKKAVIRPSGNNFKFNFPCQKITDDLCSPSAVTGSNGTILNDNKCHLFDRSDNSFKFNFSVDEDQENLS